MNQQRFKPFFFHFDELKGIHPAAMKFLNSVQRHRPRGFTVFVQPDEHPHRVQIQVTMCSSKDTFCKKVGREQAQKHEIITINARELPNKLVELTRKTTYGYADRNQFLYILKYVI